MYKFSENNFQKGLNKDFDERIVPPNTYRDAVNVTLVREGEIMSLTTIKGSTKTATFDDKVTDNVTILGDYECNTEKGKGVIIFYKGEDIYGAKFSGIKLLNFSDNIVYDLTDVGANDWLNFADVFYVDGVIDTDNGEDILYFVDGVNIPRSIKCLTTTKIVNEKQICGVRYSPIDKITYDNVSVGGELLSGSYQIGYQYINTETGAESTPSLFTNQISIYPSTETDYEKVYGGVPNEQTNKKISLKIPAPAYNSHINEIRNLYNAVSLLILKSVDGLKVASNIVLVTTPSKDIYNTVTNGIAFDYLGSEQYTETTLSDINVDDALIKTAQTISIKEGNLFLGNITYRDLSLKDSEGIVGDAYSITKSLGVSSKVLKNDYILETPTESEVESNGGHKGGYLNPLNIANYKSEMRGEVIRYGIAYTDQYGGWSEPRAIDFSGFSAFSRISNFNRAVSNIVYNESVGGTYIDVANTPEGNFEIGDFIEFNNIDTPLLILESTYNGDSSYTLLVDGKVGSSNTFAFLLKGGKYSNTLGIDWKFPERKNPKFTLLDKKQEGNITSLGLALRNISNHPEWAVGLSIVRVSRDKNILTQAITIPCSTGNGSSGLEGDDQKSAPYANITGSFFAKPLSRGGNVNTTRWTPDNEGYAEPLRSDSWDGDIGGRHDVLTLVKLLSPDYMYSNVANTEIYDSSWFGLGYKLDIVDAISTIRTKSIPFNDQVDDGDNKGDQQAFSFRADSDRNFYYQRNTKSSNLELIKDPNNSRPLYRSNNTIKGYYPAVNGIAPIALPVSLLPNNPTIRNIVTIGDLKGVSGFNTSEQYASEKNINPQEQKGVYVVLNEVMGDLSYFAAELGNNSNTNTAYYKDYLNFNRLGSSFFYNINTVNLSKYGGSSTEWNNKIDEPLNSSIGVLAITNVVKGLLDNRYGDKDKQHLYFPTGSYIPLYDRSDVSTEVFGGDTFISKPTFKVNDTILGAFRLNESGSDSDKNSDTAIRAYSDWVELVSCYVESDVNSQLQANPYGYPIENKANKIEFVTDFNYPYHFGYSAKNFSKVWVNTANKDREATTKYESRVIYSEKHIVNSTDGNYSRFRTASKYDLDGSYGSITKLLKAYDDNIYCLQRNGFSLIPIGKKTIEDGAGGEMIINTSDTITTPKYFLNNNGCQNIESVKQSKDSFFWVDKDRREVFAFRGQPMRISDMGMYSYFNDVLDKTTERLSGTFDFDREEYILSIGNKSVVFSAKADMWVSRFDLNQFVAFVNGEDRLFAIGKNGLETSIEEMYVTDEMGNVFGIYNDSTVELTFNDGGSIPKTFDVLRVDSTAHIDEAQMTVRDVNDNSLDTGVFAITNRSRQGGYEFAAVRDLNTNQRLRGKACKLVLTVKNDVNTKSVSINNVLLKYRESPDAFIKRYSKTE